MPVYDYLCGTCDHLFEMKQSFSSEPVATCPKCSKLAARQFNAVPIVFKGSGWYVNDYGKSGSSNASTSEPNDPAKTTSKSESQGSDDSKSGTKPASDSKADSKPKAEKSPKSKAKSSTGKSKGA